MFIMYIWYYTTIKIYLTVFKRNCSFRCNKLVKQRTKIIFMDAVCALQHKFTCVQTFELHSLMQIPKDSLFKN